MDLNPVISDRTLNPDWDFSQSVDDAIRLHQYAPSSLADYAIEIWQAFMHCERSPGGSQVRKFSWRQWCEDTNIPRTSATKVARSFDPQLDAEMKRETADRKALQAASIEQEVEKDPEGVWSHVAPLSGAIERISKKMRIAYADCMPVLELVDAIDLLKDTWIDTWKDQTIPCPDCDGIGCDANPDGLVGRPAVDPPTR